MQRSLSATKAIHSCLNGAVVAALLLAAGTSFSQDEHAGTASKGSKNLPALFPAPTPIDISVAKATAQDPLENPAGTPAAPGAETADPVAQVSAGDDDDPIVKQGPVTPNVDFEKPRADEVYTIHLRPLFSTVVRLPEVVTTIVVGAPTLIDAEHDKGEGKLVFLKPTTHQPIDSNVIIALQSGRTLAIRVISAGDAGSTDPVDFVVDYSQSRSLMLSSDSLMVSSGPEEVTATEGSTMPEVNHKRASRNPDAEGVSEPRSERNEQPEGPASLPSSRPDGLSNQTTTPSNTVTDTTPVADNEMPLHPDAKAPPGTLIEAFYEQQMEVAAPHYTNANDLIRIYPEDKSASPDLAVSLGHCIQQNNTVTLSYSVINHSRRWVEILPPILQFNNPAKANKNGKVDKKNPASLAEQMEVTDYRMTKNKLAPGERLDAVIQFVRPDFKYKREHLFLQIANANEVDTALLVPLPFIISER